MTMRDLECTSRLADPGDVRPMREESRGCPALCVLWVSLLVPIFAGCQQQLRPIFEEQEPAIVWPPSPAQPRIRYLGEIRGEADLKPPPKPFQALGELIVGPRPQERLYGPRSVLCSEDGSIVWVADIGGRCLHRLDLEKRKYVKVQRAGDSPLLSPVGLCLGPQDSIYLCDSEAGAIYHLAGRDGSLIESLRVPEDIGRPVAADFDPATQELYVVDVSNHDLKVLGMDGSLRRIIGKRGEGKGQFNFPCAIAGNGAQIWVVDAGNHRVQGLSRSGAPLVSFGQAGDASGDLALPKSVALDSDGHLYVVDARFETVQVFDRAGRLLLAFGEEGTRRGQFWLPAGVWVDVHDRIWVCDCYNQRLQVFQYLKAPEPQASQPNTAASPARETTRPGGTVR